VSTEVVGLVLAGGEGTRLRSARPAVPKPLVEVGGVPMLELALRRLAAAGVREAWVALRHEAARLRAFLGELQPSLDLCIHVLEEPEPLGTFGAAYYLRDLGRTVLAVNGDLVSAIDLAELVRSHRRHEAHLTIATHLEHHRLKLGEVVTAADGRVVEYLEKPVKSWTISSGSYVLESDVLALLEKPEWLGFPTLVRRALDAHFLVRAEPHQEPWIDVNDADDLARANELVAADPEAFGVARSPRERVE
jgi:NDP-sugar pyrophosphorylase family protein